MLKRREFIQKASLATAVIPFAAWPTLYTPAPEPTAPEPQFDLHVTHLVYTSRDQQTEVLQQFFATHPKWEYKWQGKWQRPCVVDVHNLILSAGACCEVSSLDYTIIDTQGSGNRMMIMKPGASLIFYDTHYSTRLRRRKFPSCGACMLHIHDRDSLWNWRPA